MKTLASICAAIALMAGIGCATLWTELRKERLANVALQSRVADVRAASLAPAAPAPVMASVAPVPAASPATETPVCKPDAATPKPATSTANVLENSMNLQRELMKDPEYRKLQLAQTRANMERSYPGLVEELGLSEKEADKLFDLLAESQTTMSAETTVTSINGTLDQAAMQEAAQRRQVLQREQDEALRTMLGSKFTQWQDYQQTRPARTRVTSLGTQLAQAGMPLSEAQTRSLTTAMIAEQQRQTQEARTMTRTLPTNPADPEYRIKMREESLQRTEENNRRLVEVAAPHMSARQLATYRAQMEQQTAMSRISMKMAIEQERLQLQSQSQPK